MAFCKYYPTYKLYNLGFFTRCTVKALQKLQGQVCIELFRWCLLYLNWTGYMTLLCPTIFSIIEVFNRPFCCNKNLFLQVLWSFSRCIFLKNQEYMIYLWYNIWKVPNVAIFMPRLVVWDEITSPEMNRSLVLTLQFFCTPQILNQ